LNGEFLLGKNRYQEAIKTFETIITDYPQFDLIPNAKYNIARCYMETKNYDLAITDFLYVFTNYRDHALAPNALIQAGRIFQMNNQNKDAIESYEKVGQNYSDMDIASEAFYNIGKIYLSENDAASAERYFLRSSGYKNNNIYADKSRIELAFLLLKNNESRKAIEMLENISSTRTDNVGAEAQYRIGEIYYSAGNYKDALAAFLRIKYLFPKENDLIAMSMLKAGLCYEAMDDMENAKKIYNDVVKLKCSDTYIKEAQTRLNNLSN
jgi:tol-pal system protein YbgF